MAVTLKGSAANYLGESTDDKPSDAGINAIFTELDTNTDYYFDGTEWKKVGAESEASNG